MSSSQFVGTSFQEGLKAPHFIDGRLLNAEDLKCDQTSTLQRLEWLGQAGGPGIVTGLMAGKSGSSLKITRGFGFNRMGQVVALSGEDPVIPLALPASNIEYLDAAQRFSPCQVKSTSGETISGGAYLLTAVPASRFEGLAPVKAATGSNTPPACVAQWEVEGVQFKVIRLDEFDPAIKLNLDLMANRSLLRSLLAQWCFDTTTIAGLPGNPFDLQRAYGGLALLDSQDLTACDLPLAVFYWTGNQLLFVDPWAVRRRPVRPDGLQNGRMDGREVSWRAFLSDTRVSTGQARFLQFQEQLDWLSATHDLVAANFFVALPPVGFVPVSAVSVLKMLRQMAEDGQTDLNKLKELGIIAALEERAKTTQGGFDLVKFWGESVRLRLGLIYGETVDFTLQRSWYDNVIDLTKSKNQKIQLYLVRENLFDKTVPLYVMFVKSMTPVLWLDSLRPES
jgi:hypothetical protein